MKEGTPKHTRLRIVQALWLLTGLSFSTGAMAQNKTADESVVELSPFVVSGDTDRGYQATYTLAGTRLKSDVKDIAGAIQVLTSEFLQDTASNSAKDLLVYTTNTEVGGAGGNMSGTGGGDVDYSRRNDKEPTRVRGLVGADLTRNYFLTDIGYEAYNTERVVINRGPNSILFGLGSPGGIINNSLKTALFKNFGEASFSYGSFNSHREVLDLNRQIIDHRWSVRGIFLNKEDGYQQVEGYRREQRKFFTSTARLTNTTTFRFNAEFGDMNGARPSVLTPKRSALLWIEKGMPLNPFVGRLPTAAENLALFGTNTPEFTIWTYNRGPLFMLNDVKSMQFGLGWDGGGGGPRGTSMNLARPYMLEDSSDTSRRTAPMTDADRWLYDFRKHFLPGRSNTQDYNFRAYNATLEQTFLENQAGLELAYDWQSYESGYYDRLGDQPYVDVNEFLPNGDPNPNVGRAYLEYVAPWARRKTQRGAFRATAFYNLDFAHKAHGLARWLGRHVISPNYTRQTIDVKSWGSSNASVVDLATDAILEANARKPGAFFADSFDRRVQGSVYVGDPIKNDGMAHIRSVTVPDILSYPTYMYDSTATPVHPGDRGAYVQRVVNVIGRPITYGSLDRQKLETAAINMQSFLFNDNIVATTGWRKDKSARYTDNTPDRTDDHISLLDTLKLPSEPDDTVTAEIFSWGVVGHLPASWSQRFLHGIALSAHYGKSQNFQPQPGRVNIWNEPLASPAGDTTEYGFSVGLPDNKALLRVNWFQTNMTGISTGGTGNIPNYERLFYNNVRTLAQGPGQANEHWADVYTLPPIQMRQLYWDPVEPNPAPGGTLTVSDHPNNSVTDTEDESAKGIELEGVLNPTRNWTFTFNVAKQQSIQTNIRPAQLRYLAVREPQWQAMANLVAQDPITVGNFAFNTIAKGIRDAAALDGAINPEVRKWRANMVTRYSFDSRGWLRGVDIGGAYRWQSKNAIGFERLPDSKINDVTKPLYGPETYNADLFVNRTQSLFHGKVKWKVQLNIRNLTNKDDLIPVAKDFDGSVVSLMVPNPRTFELTNSFQF